MAEAGTNTAPPPLRLPTRIAYGFGAVAYGAKDSGFSYFLLLFYGTVVGLEPGLVGLAIFVALLLDAVSDPLVGYWSDNTSSRWGRRHPFLYAAALPVSASYFLLWNPPMDWSEPALFAWLLVLAVLIRTFITFYETPSSAMMPELTRGYEERTALQSWRTLFGWTGGNLLTVLMFGVLLVPTAQYGDGILNRDAYRTYGLIASALIFAAIMVSAIGTHHRIPTFSQPSEREPFSLRRLFGEMFETLRDRSFVALFWATLLGAVATGVAASLAFILLTYFWQFDETQRFIWVALVFVSAVIGFAIAPRAVRRWGKKRAAIGLGIVAFTIAPLPVALRLAGWFPENGDPVLFPLVATINTLDLALIIAAQAMLYSMIADLVENSQLRTGRRSEGVFYAAVTFTRKANQGLGAFIGGLILSLVAFPENTDPSAVPDAVLWNLGAIYVPVLVLLWFSMIYAISRYRIDKATHEANLAALAAAPVKSGGRHIGPPA